MITYSKQINIDGTESDIWFIADNGDGSFKIFNKDAPDYQAYLASQTIQ